MEATLNGDALTYVCSGCGEPAARLVLDRRNRWSAWCTTGCAPIGPIAHELPVHRANKLTDLLGATTLYWRNRGPR